MLSFCECKAASHRMGNKAVIAVLHLLRAQQDKRFKKSQRTNQNWAAEQFADDYFSAHKLHSQSRKPKHPGPVQCCFVIFKEIQVRSTLEMT